MRMDGVQIAEGFRGQIMYVLPRPFLAEATRHLLVAELYPTDIGFYPRARHHYRERPQGAPEFILIYCRAGGGRFDVDGCEGALTAGQALIIPRGRPHSYAAEERRPWSILWVHFSGEDAALYGDLLPRGQHVLPVARTAGDRAARLFRDCFRAFGGGFTPATLLYASQALRHLLATLFFDNAAFTAGARAQGQPRIDDSILFMGRRMAQGLSLAELARQAGLSAGYYSTMFRTHTGFSPIEYYNRLRIQAACRLLDTTTLPIHAVAENMGYVDPYYFSRAFRKVMGVSPRTYRENRKG
jgi:AraC-like DNA-binding protein